MKKSTHTMQDTIFGAIPRSEFVGVAFGYALGLAAEGMLHMDGMLLEIIGVAIGFGIGWWIDHQYFREEDIPVEEIEAAWESDASV